MSVISLLNEQLKNTLNKTTKELIISISDQFNIPYKDLLNMWNEVNPSFKHNFERKVIIDEDVIIVKKPRVEDEEVIVVKKPRVIIED